MRKAVGVVKSFSAIQWVIFGIVGVLSFLLVLSCVSNAASYEGRILGREAYRGYFDNQLDYYGSAVLPGNASNPAIPSIVNSPREFVDLMISNNRSKTSEWRRTGAAFIYNTMMGHNAPGIGKYVSDNQWNDLYNRLQALHNAGRISWTGNVSGSINSYYQDDRDDVAFYREQKNESGIRIYDYNGNLIYRLIRRCANPLGDGIVGLPKARWFVSVGVSVSPSSVQPGGTITWTHRITNDGPASTNQNVAYGYKNGSVLGSGESLPWTLSSGTAADTSRSKTSTYTTKAGSSQVDKTLCRSTIAKPRSSLNSGQIASSPACVTVSAPPLDYDLIPTVSLNTSEIMVPETEVKVTGKIDNTGSTSSPSSTKWQLSQIVAAPGASIVHSSGGTSNSVPCSYFTGGTCKSLASGNRAISTKGYETEKDITADADWAIGTKVCFAMSVQPYNESTTKWRHSTLVCLTVGKKPKTQVLGGDIMVGRTFAGKTVTTSSYVQTGLTNKITGSHTGAFGSWAEYGILAPSYIRGMASNSGLNVLSGASASQSSWSALTFANTMTTNCDGKVKFGCYTTVGSMGIIPDVASRFPVTNSGSNSINLNSRTLGKGESLIINAPKATVNINGNLEYADVSYNNATEIPQVVIIANNIHISPSVANVDAWLIASGSGGNIDTCHFNNYKTIVPIDADPNCETKLTINGPVMAKHLWLRRTAGSGTGVSSGAPAEIINLRADAYLWAALRSQSTGRVQTVYITEKAVRY
jgi:hypothetical protein